MAQVPPDVRNGDSGSGSSQEDSKKSEEEQKQSLDPIKVPDRTDQKKEPSESDTVSREFTSDPGPDGPAGKGSGSPAGSSPGREGEKVTKEKEVEKVEEEIGQEQQESSTKEQINSFFSIQDTREKAQDLKQGIKQKGLNQAENVQRRVRQEMPFQSPETREKTESFVRNVQAEEQAQRNREDLERQIEEIESAPENSIFTVEGEEVSRSEALNRLEEARESATERAESAEENQLSLFQDNSGPEVIQWSSIPLDRSDLEDENNNFRKAPTDGKNVQYAGGTRIDNGFSQGNAMSNPEFRKNFQENVETGRDLSTLVGTEAGFKALPAIVDPDRTVSGVIEKEKTEAENQGTGENVLEFLGSPGGVLFTGGVAKGAGTLVKGVQASTGLGTGKLGSALGTTAKVGGAGLVGLQVAKGSRNVAQGDITEGGGQILQVGAEAGAVVKGFRSAQDQYGRKLARTTKVQQENVLKNIDEGGDSVLVGSGELTARTRVLQNNPLNVNQGDEVVDEITSTGNYRLVADEDGSEARGVITDNLPDGSNTEKDFQSFSTVVGREGDKVQVGNEIQDLGENEIATRNVLRTEREGKVFRSFEDSSRTSISRKEGEKPVNTIRSFNLESLDEPVQGEKGFAEAIQRENVNAKNVEFTSYTNDQDGEIFSETSNLVFQRRSGSGQESFSGGQGLQFRSRYSGGFIQETGRQAEAGAQFGARNREIAEESLETGSDLQTFSTSGSGGSGQGQGSQAGLGTSFQARKITGQENNVETGGQNLRVTRTSTGQSLTTETGSTVQAASGQQTQGNRLTSRTETGTETRGRQKNNIRQVLNTNQVLDSTQKTGQVNRQIGRSALRSRNSLKGVQGTRTGKISTGKIGTVTVPQIKASRKTTTIQIQRTSAVETPTSITSRAVSPGGGGILPPDLEFSSGTGSRKGEGRLGTPGNFKKDLNVSLLSANRAELLTGKKTLDTDTASSFSQSPFSGGIQTVQEQNLGKRKYKSDKEVDFF